MKSLEPYFQETKTISISVGNGSNYGEKGSEKLSFNMVSVSPWPGSVERSSFAEAKKRLIKLERDYQHTYEKYTEVQSNKYKYCTKLRRVDHHSRWAGYCIGHSKDLVEQLQNVLDKLNTEEATQRGREPPSNSKQFFLMHRCKSLAQEKMILQQKAENKEQYNDGLSQEPIDVKRINEEFSNIQRMIPKSSSKKPIHDLLKRVKEIKKLTEKAITNRALVGNRTSQDNMKSSTSTEIKLLTKVIRDFEKERGKTKSILQDERIEKRYTEKMRHLKEKYKCIGEKQDAEKKYILDLKENFRSRHKAYFAKKKVTSEIYF